MEGAMKRLLCVIALVLPFNILIASDWNLVYVPAPDNAKSLAEANFKLFHRAGDFWIGSLPEGAELPAGGRILTGYRPDGGEVFRLLLASPSEGDKLEGRVNLLFRSEAEAIFQATIPQLESLPEIRGEWIRITLWPKPLGYSGVGVPQTDDFHPFVQELVNQVSQAQYTDYIQTLEDFVSRNTLTTGCDDAAAWILSQFQSFGLDAHYNDFTISGDIKHNVVGELTGFLYPDSIIFITGHYDATAGSPWSAEPVAPGADDNGSGASCVIECARILSQYNFEKTIRFVAFAGEEQGLYGSEDYVQDLLNAGTLVVGSFNYDMIAWSGSDPPPPDMVIYADYNPLSQAMANKIAEAITTFVPNSVEPDIDISPTMTGSDHSPFWDAGWPAICGIEEQAWGPDFNPYYHSVEDLVVNCDLEYATNCTRAAIAALADYAVPIVESGPYLAINDKEFEEVVGNGNGAPDPGETISILVTLINVGTEPATGVSATLTTTDPYLTITQNSATYPDLNPQSTGTGSQPYVLDISLSCPQGTWVSTELQITAAGGYENTCPINFMVGNPAYEPTGPDAYGYLIFDPNDEPEFPVYEWVEICADSGGPGTLVNFTQDDQTFQFDLPFTFQYYGQDYDRYTIAANGWIGMGDILEDDYSNSGIPNSDGPPAMIAPYWEDLSPQRTNSGKVWRWYDTINNRLVVEYNHIEQYAPAGAFETFQVILLDPVYHPTPTGDGSIYFQYKQLSTATTSEGTVGIEDSSETIGLQYFYDGAYDQHATPLENLMALLITTVEGYPDVVVELTPYGTPIQIPATGGTFDYNIAITNNDPGSQTFDGWCDVTLPNGSQFGPVLGPVNLTLGPGISINRDRTQAVPQGAPFGIYTYHGYAGIYPDVVWATDSFTFEKLEDFTGVVQTEWNNWGEGFGDEEKGAAQPLPQEFLLYSAHPNPFNPITTIGYQLPVASRVSLEIFDVSGRLIGTPLRESWRDAGYHELTFDGSDLASGIYIYRLTAGDFTASGKMVLMK